MAPWRLTSPYVGLRPVTPQNAPNMDRLRHQGVDFRNSHSVFVTVTTANASVIATGHFRSGILLAPITARLMREWITGGGVSAEWDRFSPMRFENLKVSSAGNKFN